MLREGGAVFQSRREAEEADHARHQAKQERVAERRRINWEKKAAVGRLDCLVAMGSLDGYIRTH